MTNNDPLKRQLATLIADAMRARGLCQFRGPSRMGIDQPKISRILHAKLDGFSVTRLLNLLLALGCDIDIEIRLAPRTRKQGVLRVTTDLSS